MSLNIRKKFTFKTVGGFTSTKQVKILDENREVAGFVKDNLSGSILTTSLDITADKKGEEVLFSYRNGDFISVYGEKSGEVFAKTFRCRKPLLLRMSNGREFRLRTSNIWKQYLLLPQTYTLTGEHGVEAVYKFSADKSSFSGKISENNTISADIIVMLGALMLFKSLHVGDTKDFSRIIEAEDKEDLKDARFIARAACAIGILSFIAWLLSCLEWLLKK